MNWNKKYWYKGQLPAPLEKLNPIRIIKHVVNNLNSILKYMQNTKVIPFIRVVIQY